MEGVRVTDPDFVLHRIIETHYKSPVVLLSFLITVGGWWAWQAFLAGIYAPQASPYDVRSSFFDAFGKDLAWWLTLIIILLVLFVLDLGFKMAKRTLTILGLWKWGRGWFMQVRRWRKEGREDWLDGHLEEYDLGLWQEMEKDRKVRGRLARISEGDGEEERETKDFEGGQDV